MKENRKFTESQKVAFKMWLVRNQLSFKDFTRKCGVTHQYIYFVINGKCNVTSRVIETFKKGGYSIEEGKGVGE